MKLLNKSLLIEIFLVGIIIGGFALMAGQKIGFYPVPWKDEPWLMQPAFEVLKTGKMSMPMFRHFGNELGERIFTDPVFTYLLAGWFRVFGFGILQARLFNLTLSVGALLLVYLIGRLLAGRTAGLIAITLLVSDNNYFTGSRFLRNDFASLFFALASAFSYLKAKILLTEKKQLGRIYLVAAGLLATMSALSHLNGLYIIVLLAIWLFVDYGWRFIIKLDPWILAISINLIALPYFIYCWINREIYAAQWNIFTPERTQGMTSKGLWANILQEPKRYENWDYGIMFMTTNRAVIFFKVFTVLAIIYLLTKIIQQVRQKQLLSSAPYIYLLTAIFWIVIFFATEVSNKTHSYLPHLTSWFALAIGILGRDLSKKVIFWTPELRKWLGENNLGELSEITLDKTRLASRALIAVIGVILFIYLSGVLVLAAKYQKYLLTIQPTQYNQMVTELKKVVTPDLIPIGIPNYWHLFAEQRDDYRAFSRRLTKRVLKGDFPNEQYAFICDKRQQRKLFALSEEIGEEAKRQIHEIAKIPDPTYGEIRVYYIGANPAYLSK